MTASNEQFVIVISGEEESLRRPQPARSKPAPADVIGYAPGHTTIPWILSSPADTGRSFKGRVDDLLCRRSHNVRARRSTRCEWRI